MKKILITFDPEKPQSDSNDFLAPVTENGRVELFGIKSRKIQPLGLVVFTGRDLLPNDVFARLVDSGRKIESVDSVLLDMSDYLVALKDQRIGDIVKVDRQNGRVILTKIDVRPNSKRVSLP